MNRTWSAPSPVMVRRRAGLSGPQHFETNNRHQLDEKTKTFASEQSTCHKQMMTWHWHSMRAGNNRVCTIRCAKYRKNHLCYKLLRMREVLLASFWRQLIWRYFLHLSFLWPFTWHDQRRQWQKGKQWQSQVNFERSWDAVWPLRPWQRRSKDMTKILQRHDIDMTMSW